MDESSGKVQGASTHPCGIVMDIAAFEVSHSSALDRDSTARVSAVVMDVAAYKVSHSAGDIHATALQAARATSKAP